MVLAYVHTTLGLYGGSTSPFSSLSKSYIKNGCFLIGSLSSIEPNRSDGSLCRSYMKSVQIVNLQKAVLLLMKYCLFRKQNT